MQDSRQQVSGANIANTAEAAIAATIQAAIAYSSDVAEFRNLLSALMARPGRALSPHGPAKWPALVLVTCGVLGGDPTAAVRAAAAVEFTVAAIDVVDDLVDNEWPEELGDPARALNASLALSWLAWWCISDLEGHIGAERARRIRTIVSVGSLASCVGQDRDLVLEDMADVSEDVAYEVTCRKSGSLVAMACQVGAAIATDDPAVLEILRGFGVHIGVIAQLLNDLVDVDPGATTRGNDLQRRKKTLPITYALRCAAEEVTTSILHRYRSGAILSAGDEEQLVMTLRDLGALHYTWIVAEIHRREALALLPELAHLTGSNDVFGLRQLVPPVQLHSPLR